MNVLCGIHLRYKTNEVKIFNLIGNFVLLIDFNKCKFNKTTETKKIYFQTKIASSPLWNSIAKRQVFSKKGQVYINIEFFKR